MRSLGPSGNSSKNTNTKNKIAVLEAARKAKATLQYREVQPRWLPRDSNSHRRAKLKALADKLMSRFTVLEMEQQVEGTARKEVEGMTLQESHWDADDGRSTLIMTVSSMPALGRQETTEEIGLEDTDSREEPVTMPLSGESPTVPDISQQLPHDPGHVGTRVLTL